MALDSSNHRNSMILLVPSHALETPVLFLSKFSLNFYFKKATLLRSASRLNHVTHSQDKEILPAHFKNRQLYSLQSNLHCTAPGLEFTVKFSAFPQHVHFSDGKYLNVCIFSTDLHMSNASVCSLETLSCSLFPWLMQPPVPRHPYSWMWVELPICLMHVIRVDASRCDLDKSSLWRKEQTPGCSCGGWKHTCCIQYVKTFHIWDCCMIFVMMCNCLPYAIFLPCVYHYV